MSNDPRDLARARATWTYRGQQRPPFARRPGPGQESVWDYPRPPAYRPTHRHIEVWAGTRQLASSDEAIRVCETGGPPGFYLPPAAVEPSLLIPSARRTHCEWKGQAVYFHVEGSAGRVENAVWCYPETYPEAASIAGWYACYPSLLRCLVDGELVRPQGGGYYGGWVTDEIVGPFKGEPGVANL
ncbi:MAG: DUF427 domain-containing protein [Chromatiaceae bacterium]|nr:MAG: DUF427 domain-containing protein [Chromatiaceae bacterium]